MVSPVFFRSGFRLLGVVVAVLLLASSPVLAQLGTGSIEGVVLDPDGAVIPGAEVTVRNAGTGIERVLTTDATGRFRAVSLEPGLYEIKATKAGFRIAERKGVQVVVGSTATADLTLQVGAATETVTVTESAPVIDTEKTDVTSTVSEEVVANVPVIGRRFDNYVLLTPGVSPDGSFGLITYRGISGLYNNNTVDGADNNQAFFSEARGRTRAVYTYSQASI
ncbi:MAG: carboxypeptidase-like regulatory domain-containing protein, partial [Candidatus Acidiferrales bacterium]